MKDLVLAAMPTQGLAAITQSKISLINLPVVLTHSCSKPSYYALEVAPATGCLVYIIIFSYPYQVPNGTNKSRRD